MTRLIDIEEFDRCTGKKNSIKRELGQHFVSTISQRLEDLLCAVDKGHVKDVERVAHSLKSSVSLFGARPLIDLAERIEDDAATKNLPVDLRDRICDLKTLVEELSVEIQQYLQTLKD